MTSPRGDSLAKRLGVRAGSSVRLVGAPSAFKAALRPLPPGARLASGTPVASSARSEPSTRRATPARPARGSASAHAVVVVFAHDERTLATSLARAARGAVHTTELWVAWPKRDAAGESSLDFDAVQRVGLALGLVDDKVSALDGRWTGLRFAVPRTRRARR
jgi:hypothetical protein